MGIGRQRSPDAILRIVPNRSPEFASAVFGREARVLGVLGGAVMTPVVLGLDTAGGGAGQPALLMSCLPGRAMTLSKESGHDWITMAQEIGRTLAEIHRAVPAGDPSVPSVVFDWLQPDALGASVEYASSPWRGFWQELQGLAGETEIASDGFIQRDVRVADLLWDRVHLRISGVLGWERAGFGPRGWDLAKARLDATLQCGGFEPADLVIDAYEAAWGDPVVDRRFWDLAVALSSIEALDVLQRGYAELGRLDLMQPTLWTRLLEFVRHR
jgi:aminoglycoside phosphotransferase (APT) family kinase protein